MPRGRTPEVDHDTLNDFGFRLIIAPMVCMGAAGSAIAAALEDLENHNGKRGSEILSPAKLFDAVGLPFWQDLQERFGSPSEARTDDIDVLAQQVQR